MMGVRDQIGRNLVERIDVLLGKRGDPRQHAVRKGEIDALVRKSIERTAAAERAGADTAEDGDAWITDFRNAADHDSGVYGFGSRSGSRPDVGPAGVALLMRRLGQLPAKFWMAVPLWGGRGNNEPRVFFRSSSADPLDMSPWREAYHQGRAVGPVSMDGQGDPDGVIMEFTHDATNGDCLRLCDGTQICWHSGTDPGATANTAVGSLFWSPADLTWTYPKPFQSGTELEVRADFATMGSWGTCGSTTSTSTAFRRMHPSSTGTAAPFRLSAIGRWAPYPL